MKYLREVSLILCVLWVGIGRGTAGGLPNTIFYYCSYVIISS